MLVVVTAHIWPTPKLIYYSRTFKEIHYSVTNVNKSFSLCPIVHDGLY